MHFLLVGPGALGCLLSSIVSRGLAESDRLTILDYNTDRADHLSRQGILYHLDEQRLQVPVTAVSDPQLLDPVDVVLLCVKSYDVMSSLAFCQPVLSKQTLLIFLQNGISHLAVKERLHHTSAAFATTTEGATLLAAGQVRHAGSGETFLGFLEPPEQRGAELLQKTRDILAAGGLQVSLTDNILARLWAKLFINVGINALTAILGCKNGDLLTLPDIDGRMQRAVGEAVGIARIKNIPVAGDPYEATRLVCRKTAGNISSMLQDVTNRRRTEIDAINGAIVALAESLAIDTPENSLLCHQIKEIESAYAQQ